MNQGERHKFLDGPFKGLICEVVEDNQTNRTYTLRFYLYDRKFTLPYMEVHNWQHQKQE